ncbi:hypothetical protein WN51_11648 [Melipona quadrifasciata]|uniref:Uncharacterized protein n=1 Tax=Melipona quadrifasciata TaxID=166423 RepID=A0A0M9A391_9HYME|nr:hypothetical protein WN51_11648 [Melipona quadrifasciata]
MPQGVRKPFLLESRVAFVTSIIRESNKLKDTRCQFMVETPPTNILNVAMSRSIKLNRTERIYTNGSKLDHHIAYAVLWFSYDELKSDGTRCSRKLYVGVTLAEMKWKGSDENRTLHSPITIKNVIICIRIVSWTANEKKLACSSYSASMPPISQFYFDYNLPSDRHLYRQQCHNDVFTLIEDFAQTTINNLPSDLLKLGVKLFWTVPGLTIDTLTMYENKGA